MNKEIKSVVIAGGGTAGWMAAAAIAKLLGKNLSITLVESEEISTVGVGEATIPPLQTFHRLLGIDEAEFMRAVRGTFKLGINFESWRAVGEDYFHSFGTTGRDCWASTFQHFWQRGLAEGYKADYGSYCPEVLAAKQNKFAHGGGQPLKYAYHMDASQYAVYLRGLAERHGVKRVEGKIDRVNVDPESGNIFSLVLAGGETLAGDLFIDCTGFRALLVEGALHAGFDDWSHWLPCDSAVAVQTKGGSDLPPYTRSIAREAGWQWQIPLQHRVGNGLVYCSKYLSDENAKHTLLNNLDGEPLTEPKIIKFKTGQRRKSWVKNCVAIGLSSGFLEPLESTSIHLIQRGIIRLLQLFPVNGIAPTLRDEYNKQSKSEIEFIRDFIILHYKVTNRADQPFWRYCKAMDVPSSLAHRIELFKQTGRIFRTEGELFSENSWIQVMMGQGVMPQEYHPIANQMTEDEQAHFLNGLRNSTEMSVKALPAHKDYIAQYCAAFAQE